MNFGDMDIENIINVVTLMGALMSTLAAFGKKIYEKLLESRVKISVNEYLNMESTLFLIMSEVIGILAVHLLALIFTPIFGERSSWEKLYFVEYGFHVVLLFCVYLLSIIYVIKSKMEGKNLIKNLLLASLICVVISCDMFLGFQDKQEIVPTLGFILIVICVVFLQAEMNIKPKQVKRIRYKIYTKEKVYRTIFEPVVKAEDLFIKMADEQGNVKKMIQIPVRTVEKIEHIVEEL